jgi:hypothetical protein
VGYADAKASGSVAQRNSSSLCCANARHHRNARADEKQTGLHARERFGRISAPDAR